MNARILLSIVDEFRGEEIDPFALAAKVAAAQKQIDAKLARDAGNNEIADAIETSE